MNYQPLSRGQRAPHWEDDEIKKVQKGIPEKVSLLVDISHILSMFHLQAILFSHVFVACCFFPGSHFGEIALLTGRRWAGGNDVPVGVEVCLNI